MDKQRKLDIEQFITFLNETLIPDLKESGHECTAEDFTNCVKIIRECLDEIK